MCNNFSFREWFSSTQDFFEIARDLSSLPVDNIKLKPVGDGEEYSDVFERAEFDEYDAEQECRDDDVDYSPYMDGDEYSEPEEDPEFDTVSPDAWEAENPPPEMNDFSSSDEFYNKQHDWDVLYSGVEREYKKAVRQWERNQESRREQAYEDAMDAMLDEMQGCVEEKRAEHEAEQDRLEQEFNASANKVDNDGYVSEFSYNGDNFKVDLDRTTIDYSGVDLKNVFYITFRGPQGHALTRKNDAKSTKFIYNHLLASLLKLIQHEESVGRPVNGFEFTAYDTAMNLMYNKFYQDYLKPQGYLMVANHLYLKKDYIKEILSDKKSKFKKQVYNNIINASHQRRDHLADVRDRKAVSRNNEILMNKIAGSIISLYSNAKRSFIPAFITGTGIDDDGSVAVKAITATVGNYSGLYFGDLYHMKSVIDPNDGKPYDPPSQEQIYEFLRELYPKLNKLQLIPKHRENLLKYMRQYNVIQSPKVNALPKFRDFISNQRVGVGQTMQPAIQ